METHANVSTIIPIPVLTRSQRIEYGSPYNNTEPSLSISTEVNNDYTIPIKELGTPLHRITGNIPANN